MAEEEISKRLKQYIEMSGLSLRDLEKKTGISRQTILRYANGAVDNLSIDKLKVLARALGVDPAAIMGWDTEEEPAQQPYYLDDDARAAAEFLFTNPEYKVLFDASRKVKKEDIEFVKQMIERMSNNE